MGAVNVRERDRNRALSILNVSRETLNDLDRFVAELDRWRGSLNLISESNWDHLWTRHIADSGQLLTMAPKTSRIWTDIGSGGGFPGIVLAALLKSRSGSLVHLIESDAKKAAFLRHVSRETNLPVVVHLKRAEVILADLEGIDVVVSRAVAPLTSLVAWSQRQLESGAMGLFLKGEKVGDELTALNRMGSFSARLLQSATNPKSAVVEVRSVRVQGTLGE